MSGWERDHTKVICQDRISHRDVTSNTLIEATIGKDTESSSEVLLAVQPLLLERVVFWIGPDLETLATRGLSQRPEFLVVRAIFILDT